MRTGQAGDGGLLIKEVPQGEMFRNITAPTVWRRYLLRCAVLGSYPTNGIGMIAPVPEAKKKDPNRLKSNAGVAAKIILAVRRFSAGLAAEPRVVYPIDLDLNSVSEW